MSRTVAAQWPGVCALCEDQWDAGTPIAPFADRSAHSGRWGHQGCVTADAMGMTSVTAAKARLAELRKMMREQA